MTGSQAGNDPPRNSCWPATLHPELGRQRLPARLPLAGRDIFSAAEDVGVGLRGGGIRTGPLSPSDLEQLGLTNLRNSLSEIAG